MLASFLCLILPALQGTSLEEAFEDLRSDDRGRRESAHSTIRGAGGKAIPLALRFLKGADPDLKERVGILVKRLSSSVWAERNRAMNGLIEAGYPILPVLEEHFPSADSEVAWRLQVVQVRLQENRERNKVRETARNIFLVDLLGDASSREVLPVLFDRLEAAGSGLQIVSAGSLARLRTLLEQEEVDRVSGHVIEFLRGRKDPLERSRLVRFLGKLRVPVAVKPLVGLLQEGTENDVRLLRNVICSLAKIDIGAGLRAVVESLEDDRVYVRHAAHEVLREKSGRDFRFDSRQPEKETILSYQKWWEQEFGESWSKR